MNTGKLEKKELLKTTSIVSIISAISLLFSFLQESVFAYFYGVDKYTDAYNVAVVIPVTLFAIVSAAIDTVVIPCYSDELYKNGRKRAKKYVNDFATAIALITIILIIVGELFANPILYGFAPGMKGEAHIAAVNIFRMVLPTVLFTQLININTGVLHSHKSFVLPMLASNFLNVGFVICVCFLSSRYGIYAAAIGVCVGTFADFVYTVFLRRRYVKYRPSLDLKNESMHKSFKMAIPVFIGVGVADIDKFIDRIVASFLKRGSISTLNYAAKLTSAVTALVVTGITTVVYPDFAKKTSTNDEKGFADVVTFSISMLLLLLVPIVAGGTVLGSEIIKIVFGRGAFGIDKVYRTAPLFSVYLVSLIFAAIRQICSKAFYSYGDSKTPMKNSVIGIIANIIMNVSFAPLLGAIGLALATTISTMLINILLMKDLQKKNRFIKYNENIILLLKTIIASIIMVLVIKLIRIWVEGRGLYNIEDMLFVVIYLLVCVSIGGLVYIAILLALRTKEVHSLIKVIRKR